MPSSISIPVERLPVGAERLEGWEARLVEVVKAARVRPYQLGEHDCFRFACAAVEALTGFDLWQQWAGAYSTRREALVAIARFGGTFTGAGSKLFGSEPVAMSHAHRGYIAEIVDKQCEHHLGIVMGSHAMGIAEHGLMAVPRKDCAHAWRIG